MGTGDTLTTEEEEALFQEACSVVTEVTSRMEPDLAFVACAAVMLDRLEDMFLMEDDTTYPLMLANQIHAEFISLMKEYGYDLSVDTTH
jgi:hypothetical protein